MSHVSYESRCPEHVKRQSGIVYRTRTVLRIIMKLQIINRLRLEGHVADLVVSSINIDLNVVPNSFCIHALFHTVII